MRFESRIMKSERLPQGGARSITVEREVSGGPARGGFQRFFPP